MDFAAEAVPGPVYLDAGLHQKVRHRCRCWTAKGITRCKRFTQNLERVCSTFQDLELKSEWYRKRHQVQEDDLQFGKGMLAAAAKMWS